MVFEIITPQLGKGKKSNKDLVISVLRDNYPLTLAKLTQSIKKLYHADVTFQGIRKAVNDLVDKKIIIKSDREYQLNKEWILELRDFIETLQESYFNKKSGVKDVQAIGEDIKVYSFDNVIDLDVFWNRVINQWFEKNKTGKGTDYYVQQSGHTWYVLANLEEETDDIISMEMDMLEMGMDLESADELKVDLTPGEVGFDLKNFTESLKSGDLFDDNLSGLKEEFSLDDLDKPMEELEANFTLFEIRSIMEKALSAIFSLEGKITELKEQKAAEKIQAIQDQQKKALTQYIREIIDVLKKEKPKLLLTKEKVKEFKQLTTKKIAEMKAEEELELEEMAKDLLE